MKREEFESLVSSPGWGAYRAFLRARRADVMEALASDRIVLEDREKAIRECIIYKEMSELTWEQVENFYEPRETA